MRLAVIALCIGCQGESVTASTADSGNDATPANVCSVPKNLINNGNFTSGLSEWDPAEVMPTFVDGGPCGHAAHLKTNNWGSITHAGIGSFKKGQVVRLRAYFKTIKRAGGTSPIVTMRLYREVDGGMVTEEIGATAGDSLDWALADTTKTIENDATSYDVYVASRTALADEFEVTAVSVVVE